MFEKMKEKSDKGECPLYRTKEHRANMRWRKKLGKKSNWSGSKSVLFVPTGVVCEETLKMGKLENLCYIFGSVFTKKYLYGLLKR